MRASLTSSLLAVLLAAFPMAASVAGSGENDAGATAVFREQFPREQSFPREQAFDAKALREDFRQMRDAIERLHPAPYVFTPKPAFDRLFKRQFGLLDRSMTVREFYAVLAPLVARIGCGHSRLRTPEGFWEQAPDGLFPFDIALLRRKAYVVGTRGREGIPPGSEITAVNGLPMTGVVATLKDIVSADAFNDAARTETVQDWFGRLFALRFGFPRAFDISFRPPDGGEMERTVLASEDRPERASGPASEGVRTRREPGVSEDPDLGFEILERGDTAILTIRSLVYYPAVDRARFQAFVDQAFDRIKSGGIENLILDLRGNSGGSPFCAAHLLSYLEPRPVPYFARPRPDEYSRLTRPVPRAARPFEGRLFILIDGGVFSSTGHLCALLRYHGIGTFVGGETGGTFVCNDGSRDVVLRHTRIRLRIATRTFAAAVQGLPRSGILPDHAVEPAITDLLAGVDPVRDAALRLIGAANARSPDGRSSTRRRAR